MKRLRLAWLAYRVRRERRAAKEAMVYEAYRRLMRGES